MPSPRPHHPDTAPLIDAIKLTDGKPRQGEATYSVIEPAEIQEQTGRDKRTETRRRTRLLSGKVLYPNNKFLIDCQINNRSAHGARLILVAKVKVPQRIRLFSDIDGALVEADVAWQRGQNVGVNFTGAAPLPLTGAEITALRNKIYVI